MAEAPEPFDFVDESIKTAAEILVEQEENAVGMLEDLERITGIPFGELLAEGIEEPLEEGELPPGFEETPEDTIEDEFDSRNSIGDDLGDYLDEIFDESGVDGDAEDDYADNKVSLRGKADTLRRRYRHVSSNRFFYNKRAELSRRYRVITVWFIIHDEDRGYSIMNMDFLRKERPGLRQWLRGFTQPGVVGEVSLMHIYTQLVLPAINTKTGSEWKFKALLGWTGKLDTPKADDSTSSKRDKDASKRRR